jgi:Fic family protein
LTRDISPMLKRGIIIHEGAGRGVRYRERISRPLFRYIDQVTYFRTSTDDRVVHKSFEFAIFDHIRELFTEDEIRQLTALNNEYRARLARLPQDIVNREFERLTIDLSWKSSHIEGNTYSLIDTEILIKEQKEAAGHSREEAVMILNHKNTLEHIRQRGREYKSLTIDKIIDLHDIIVKDLAVSRGIRMAPVGIVGTKYHPLENQHQIREAMEKMVHTINDRLTDPFSKTIASIALLSYIQPFTDGNKRTARMLGDALLIAYGVCPLSFRSIDAGEYKKALILFYEQNNLGLLKDIFVEQFRFAVANYFL